ncbi:helix-turn-helix domain-containing protein, partial [Accumulibacter sp.]
EITFLLGFSEQSAFTRAFRRWSGMTPSAYRGPSFG